MPAGWIKMKGLQPEGVGSNDDPKGADGASAVQVASHGTSDLGGTYSREVGLELNGNDPVVYKVYKRRFFGLFQLVLLNIIVSWNWLTFSAVSTTSAEYFKVSETAINWLSTGFLFAFVGISPVVIWTLNKGGPKHAIISASLLIFVGNWIRYAGTRAPGGRFGVVIFGQILIGFAQPFVLSAPTRYSDLWFTSQGRISATAVASLSNPFGAALGQLIDPFWATKASEVPNMVLFTAILATVASIPSFFIPASPPTPPCRSAAEPKVPMMKALKTITHSVEFWLIFIPFTTYVSLFNSFSSLINQFLEPYSFSETEAGICGALLIIVGLVTSAITSPITSHHRRLQLPLIKFCVPIIALSFLAFVFAPQSYTAAAPYVIASILGAACFSLVPVALEFVAEVTHPVGPEISSTLCWTGGQLGGGIAIVVMDALKAGNDADPPENMYRSLVFQAVWACLVVPVPLCLGLFGRAEEVKSRRVEEDVGNGGSGGGGVGETGRGRIEEEEEENGEEEREGNERDEGTSWLLQGQS